LTLETSTGVLGAATLLLSIAALSATALTEHRALRRLVWLRAGCMVSAAVVVAASLAGLVSRVALGAGSVALVLSLHAIWLAMREPGSLRSYLDRLTAGGDAAWADEFERPFRHYVRRRERAPGSDRQERASG
jgi:hypothetical protein